MRRVAWIHGLGMVLMSFISIGSAQSEAWSDVNKILTLSGIPTIGSDGRIYICVGKNLIVYKPDKTVNWTATLRIGSCERRIAPIVDTAGRVYLATQKLVQIVIPQPESHSTKKYSIQLLYNITSKEGNVLGSKPITGLAATISDAAVLFYINTGVAGLYAVTIDGVPRWSLGGNVNSTDWLQSQFDSNSFCSSNATGCFFHFSPAVDLCDGSIYIAHSNGWLYAIADWQPFIRWRYYLGLTGEHSQAGVTAGNNGLVYVGAISQQTVSAIDTHTGELFWKVEVGPMSVLTCFPRVDISGWVYIGSADGMMYAISPDGVEVKKFLLLESQNSVIQAPPYLECNGGALYVAHIEVRSKLITYAASPVVSYSDALSVVVSQLNPFTGAVFWRATYPGLTTSGGGCTFDSSLILALTAQSISASGPCKNAENSLSATCVANMSMPALPDMSNKKWEDYYISIPTAFAGFMVAALCIFAYWSRTTRAARKKQRDERRKDLGIPKDKDKLTRRRAGLEKNIASIKAKLLENPTSPELQQQLYDALNELSFLEVLISESAHVAASQHGLRRRLEAVHVSPSSSGRHVVAHPLYHPHPGAAAAQTEHSTAAAQHLGYHVDMSQAAGSVPPAPAAGDPGVVHGQQEVIQHEPAPLDSSVIESRSSSSSDLGGLDVSLLTSFADDANLPT